MSADHLFSPVPSAAALDSLQQSLGSATSTRPNLAVLQLGSLQSHLITKVSDAAPITHAVPLGLELLATQIFRNHMPSEAQLEHSIMLVEDAVMPMARILPTATILATHDPYLFSVGLHALGISDSQATQTLDKPLPALSREAIEALFDKLARQATHPEVPYGDLPQSSPWAAALLILREALHHWQINTLHLWAYSPVDAAPPKG